MTAIAYAHPTISRFAIADGMLHIGDLVAVFQAGAYGMTASPTAFLGHATPTGAVGVDRRPPGLRDR